MRGRRSREATDRFQDRRGCFSLSITGAGRLEFVDWLSELISVPVKEYPRFEAALALMGGLAPPEALGLLRMRVHRLSAEVSGVALDGPWLPSQERLRSAADRAQTLGIALLHQNRGDQHQRGNDQENMDNHKQCFH